MAGTDTSRDGSVATSAMLRQPEGLVVDAAGNIYFADSKDNRVRKVSVAGVITTVAGTGFAGYSGDGGPATKATLNTPTAVAVDKSGAVYIADNMNNRLRKVDPTTGVITTIAGNGSVSPGGDGGPPLQAGFDPAHVSLDSSGNIYIADYTNDRIWKITGNVIKTIVGTGFNGYTGDSGPATAATLNGPTATAVDPAGNIYICDQYNSVIRKVSTDATISTIAGNGNFNITGDGGLATKAALYLPDSIALDPAGTKLYILSYYKVRVVDLSTNIITTFAGTGDAGFAGDGGGVTAAKFFNPYGVTAVANGDVYVSDSGNYRIRRIRNGLIDTVAGADTKDGGLATAALLSQPDAAVGLASGDILLSDTLHSRIRKVSGATGLISTVAGTGNAGWLNGRIAYPAGIAVTPDGGFVFSDYGANRVQKVSAAGTMSTLIGTAGKPGDTGDGGYALAALLNGPSGIVYDSSGNLFIADTFNYRIRRVDAVSGLISTYAGNGHSGVSGIGGQAKDAAINPTGIAVDTAGNLYIADTRHRVLKVTATTGVITIVAGTATAGYSGDGRAAILAQLSAPTGVAVDAANNLYICDYGNLVIRKVNAAGIISTIAGNGTFDSTMDSGPALTVPILPFDVSVAANGDILVSDYGFDRIRKLVPVTLRGLAVASGNNQSGASGAQLTIAAKATDSAGAAAPGVLVSFAVTSGSATVTPASALTGADGTASATVILGSQAGPAVVTASASGIASATFSLTVNATSSTPTPAISTGGVVGAGLAPGKRTVSVAGIATIFGQNLAPAGTARKVETGDLLNGAVPTNLAGTCVLVGTVRAPVFAVYPTQVNFQVPTVGTGDIAVRVITGCGTTTETQSNAATVTVQAAAPEFFSFRPSTDGKNPVAAINAVTGAYIGDSSLGAGFTPAKPKDVITVFGTNFGGTNPVVAPGDFPTAAAGVTGAVQVSLGGSTIAASAVLYAGFTPGNPGLYQLNIIVPDDVADGDLPLVVTIGGSASPSAAYLTVKK
ncbi:MAG: hypothetical protein JSU00_26185 [Acidobacteria bacterium]|nr:hypothetical protein [Acidobacteriota bacterium]